MVNVTIYTILGSYGHDWWFHDWLIGFSLSLLPKISMTDWWLTYPSEKWWSSSMASGFFNPYIKWKIIQPCLKPPTYPLVICYIAIENGHRNSGFTHWKWWFSIENGDFPLKMMIDWWNHGLIGEIMLNPMFFQLESPLDIHFSPTSTSVNHPTQPPPQVICVAPQNAGNIFWVNLL